MNSIDAGSTIHDMIRNMQVHILTAQYTQCWPEWQDLNYVPAYNKLYYIVDGEGWLEIDGREYWPKPGQLFLMPAHTLQSYSAINDNAFRKYWCHFTAPAGELDFFQWLQMPHCYEGLDQEMMMRLFRQLTEAHREVSLTARLQEKALLLTILSQLLERATPRIHSKHTQEMERLTAIQHYIETHLHEEVTLESMAAHLHLHPNYFIKYFKKHFGLSPLKYVSRKKMEKAKQLLKTTSLSIKEIAAHIGFDDANHFSKTFRREIGYSPSEYRTRI
ncbi:AraC family transcriptional regulator [Paenibacillus sp. GCM10027626]|uniref:AraC family transcriptional regulator n=1 Tax=Paenibacillus sp. GCM10027626 TaxID=3273411 RepID=UPI003625A311